MIGLIQSYMFLAVVTGIGRVSIQNTVRNLKKKYGADIDVVYGDTDSIFVQFTKPYREITAMNANEIYAYFKLPTTFLAEDIKRDCDNKGGSELNRA